MRERRASLEKNNLQITQWRQAALLAIARSSAAYQSVPKREANRQVMRLMDELYIKDPHLGNRPPVTLVEREHRIMIKRKRVPRLRRAMGLEAIWCRPRTTIPDRSNRKYPHLLRYLKIGRARQVWCTDSCQEAVKVASPAISTSLRFLCPDACRWGMGIWIR